MTTLRASMAELIERTRREIGDTDASAQAFTDAAIQDALDDHMTMIRQELTEAIPTRTATGVEYREHKARRGNLETGATLTDASFNPLTIQSANLIKGIFTISTSVARVYVTANSFNVFAAAADLLDRWAMAVKGETDFSDGRRSFKDSQKFTQLVEAAKTCRRKAGTRAVKATFITTDFTR